MMKTRTLTIVLAALLGFGVVGCAQKKPTKVQPIKVSQPVWGADNYQNGVMAWKVNDHKNSARFFQEAYNKDDARAEAMLGLLYVKGAGVFKSAEVARGYAIAADQRPDFDAYSFYHKQWAHSEDPDAAYLIAWLLANRFSGQAKQDYNEWITRAAQGGQLDARKEVDLYVN